MDRIYRGTPLVSVAKARSNIFLERRKKEKSKMLIARSVEIFFIEVSLARLLFSVLDKLVCLC